MVGPGGKDVKTAVCAFLLRPFEGAARNLGSFSPAKTAGYAVTSFAAASTSVITLSISASVVR
jgi:hypothetical protein